MEEKKKSNVYTIVIVVLLIICLGLGGYIVVNKTELFGKSNDAQETETKDDDSKSDEEEEDNYVFDTSKIVNGEGRSYEVSSEEKVKEKTDSVYKGHFKGVEYKFGEDDVVDVKITWADLKNDDFCSYDEAKKMCDSKKSGDISTRKLIFDSPAYDIKSVEMGQDITGSYMLFFKENGRIDYVKEFNALEKMEFSHPTIKGIMNPVKIYKASVTVELGGYVTTLVQTKDDKIYDLSDSKYIEK